MKALIHILFAFLFLQAHSLFAAHASATLDQLIGNQQGKAGYALISDGSTTRLRPIPLPPPPTSMPDNLKVVTTTTSYTISDADVKDNTLIVFNNTQEVSLSLPVDLLGTIPVGSVVRGLALNDLEVVLTPASGVTLITAANSGPRTFGAGASFMLVKTAPNTWAAYGNLYSRTYRMFPGQSVTLAVRINSGLGSPPRTYQWAKGGVNIEGATSPFYTIPVVAATDAGVYTVRVANAGGSTISNEYVLEIETP